VLAVAEELGLDVLGMPHAQEKIQDGAAEPRGAAAGLAQAAAASPRAGLEL
jgi:hypothetical protein